MGSTRTRIALVATLAAGGVLAAALVGVGRPEPAQGQTAVQPVTGITVTGSGSVRGTPDRADFSLIIPNQCHAAHDCGLDDADRWLAGFVPRILDSPAFTAGGLLIVTFDEDNGNDPAGGHIATVVASPAVPAGFRSDVPHDHYGVLRTIQDAWGLGCLAESCDARPLDEFFVTP